MSEEGVNFGELSLAESQATTNSKDMCVVDPANGPQTCSLNMSHILPTYRFGSMCDHTLIVVYIDKIYIFSHDDWLIDDDWV